MKQLPIAIKIVCNIVFFLIYTIIGVTITNFLFGFIVSELLGKSVPGSADPIHVKLAFFSLLFVMIITVIFREKFYFSLTKGEEGNVLSDK